MSEITIRNCEDCGKKMELMGEEARWKKMCKDCWSKSKEASGELTRIAEKTTKAYDAHKSLGSNQDAAFGMVFNCAVKTALSIMNKSDSLPDFKDVLNTSFETLWEFMVKKRAEKLG